ncbi:MAG: 16S rRNA (cytidine(1402)-2'-O)-methyltransferase [Gammaproteobacteria bacterium]|nr:16S rRNA (cytidine(1402)-2'-O)-methyltransferase [Gammaproteobacteria bacterium]
MTDNGKNGVLYVVATPIGNLEDISQRAITVLGKVSLIAAEDTRHSRKLLNHYGIAARLQALHEHNERDISKRLLRKLADGHDIALISDAGTPLISDPGFVLVRAARQAGIRVIPVPGPSALIAALSVSGLPTDSFHFEGFLPAKAAARRERLSGLQYANTTLVFYESSHRIVDSLADMAACLGGERNATLARELTKTFETVHDGTLAELGDWIQADSNQQKGEFVVVVQGAVTDPAALDAAARHTLEVLLAELPLRQAAALAAKISGVAKNRLYEYGLGLKQGR